MGSITSLKGFIFAQAPIRQRLWAQVLDSALHQRFPFSPLWDPKQWFFL